MNSTALRAEQQTIMFANENHQDFYNEYLPQCRHQDVYTKAPIYCIGISEDKNVVEELRNPDGNESGDDPILDDYDLIAYNKLRVDFEYIIELLQGMVESLDQSEEDFEEADFEHKIIALRELVGEFSADNPKLAELLNTVIDEIVADKTKYIGQDISVIINQMRYEAIDKEIEEYAKKWYINSEDVRFEAFSFRDGVVANENNLKEKADYTKYKENTAEPMAKFKFRKVMIDEFKDELMPRILPLIK